MIHHRVSRKNLAVRGIAALVIGSALGGCGTPPPQWGSPEWHRARIARWSKVIDANPTDGDAYYQRGACEQSMGDVNAAMADYAKALDLNPNANSAFGAGLYLGEFCIEAGRYEQAVAAYSKALSVPSIRASWPLRTLYFGRSKSYALTGDIDRAAVDRKKAMMFLSLEENEKVQGPPLGDQVARVIFSGLIGGFVGGAAGAAAGQGPMSPTTITTSSAAADGVNQALSREAGEAANGQGASETGEGGDVPITDEDRAEVYELRGACHAEKGDGRALDDYTRAIELASGGDVGVIAYLGRARVKAMRGDCDAALSDLAKADELSQGWAPADRFVVLARQGQVYSSLGDYDEAIRRYSSALKLSPANCRIYRDRELLFGQQDLYFERGQVYCKKGDYTRAIKDFTKALKRDVVGGVFPGPIYYERSVAYRSRGDEGRAAKDLKEARRLGYRDTPVTGN